VDLNKAFDQYGKNKAGLKVIAAFKTGSNAECEKWDNADPSLAVSAAEKVKYSSISGQSGGTAINTNYSPSAYPTIILIAPDRKIVEKDIFPTNKLPATLAKYTINNTFISNSSQSLLLNELPEVSILSFNYQSFSLYSSGTRDYTLNVFSMNGNLLKSISTGVLSEGTHSVSLDLTNVSGGAYIIQAKAGKTQSSLKILLP
jgi:hypothetical protein